MQATELWYYDTSLAITAANQQMQSKPKAKPRGRPFQKGATGNPHGRPKVVGEIRDLARQHTAAAIKTLVEICEAGSSEAARVAASQALLDRGWGRAPQELSLDVDHTVKVEAMTHEERLFEAQKLLGAIARLSALNGS